MEIPFVIKTKNKKSIQATMDKETIIFGRLGSNCEIDDSECSRRHVVISLKENELLMEDLESKNGTLVNGVRTSSCRIFIDDIISIGDTQITINSEGLAPDLVKMLTFKGNKSKRFGGDVTIGVNQDKKD